MEQVSILSEKYWPGRPIANSLFGHFVFVKLSQSLSLRVQTNSIKDRNGLLYKLKSDVHFSQFWNSVQEMYPEKEDYFASLLDTTKPYEPEWLLGEYNKFSFMKEFEELSDAEKTRLKEEFVNLRPNAFQLALKSEAQRLNCNISDVRPKTPVLPLELGHDPRFSLEALPDEILVKAMSRMDSLDFFNMSRVCWRWKNLVYDYCAQLKRAKHAVTTHLITFTYWMDPAKTPSRKAFARRYCQFSWGLVRWCCGIASNLETLIVEYPVPYSNVATLLQSCPNLKNLHLGHNSNRRDAVPGKLKPNVHLPNLEVYLCDEIEDNRETLQMKRGILCSAKCLRALMAPILDEDMDHIQFARPMTEVLGNLTALDLTHFSTNVLEILATIPNLQLKYLSLDMFDCNLDLYEDEVYEIAVKCRHAFHQLLPKLRKLEVLKTWSVPGITNETIQLLTDLDLNLQFAILTQSTVQSDLDEHRSLYDSPAGPLDPDYLIDFRDALLLRNPDLNPSDFYVLVHETMEKEEVLDEGIGFTIECTEDPISEERLSAGLFHSAMRNRLNINF